MDIAALFAEEPDGNGLQPTGRAEHLDTVTADVPAEYPTDRQTLAELGIRRVEVFCHTNGLPVPQVILSPRSRWRVSACAYYRPDTIGNRARQGYTGGECCYGINLCTVLCQVPCVEAAVRNWSWPGNAVDREPYGVMCHELWHHVDWCTGESKGRYFSDYCEQVAAKAGGEPGITSYADTNPAEYLAEAGRLFTTNPDLLRLLRPKTYGILASRWKRITAADWRQALGANVPNRVVKALINKIKNARRGILR